MSVKDTNIQAKGNKSCEGISKQNRLSKNSDDTDPQYYNTVSGVSAQYIKTQFAHQHTERSKSSGKSPYISEKKHLGGFLKNIFGKSKHRSNSFNSSTNHEDILKIPTYNPMEAESLTVPSLPVRLSMGPNDFIQLYRQRTLSDCGPSENAARKLRSKSSSKDESSDFLIDDSCDDMSKFHFLIWKDKVAGNKYFKLLKSLAIDDSSLSEPEEVFRKFLSDHAAYDLMPQSVKLLTFNTNLEVKKSFFALVENKIKAGVLWDTTQQAIIGMLTITDFMEILFQFYKNQETFEEIENHTIKSWKEQLHKRALISLGPEDSLLHGCELLLREKVHRCLVIDKFSGNPLYILTQKRILRFLFVNFEFINMPDFMQLPIGELKVGSYENVSKINNSTTLFEIMHLFIEKRISALPVVDDNNRLVNVFSKVDFANLVPDKLYRNMKMSAEEALKSRKGKFEKAHTCFATESLYSSIERLVNAEVHRLIIIDNQRCVVGILSLSDLLKCLIVRCDYMVNDANVRNFRNSTELSCR